jgi:hypothetical protein
MSQKYVYKVCGLEWGHFVSYSAPIGCGLRYTLGKWTKPTIKDSGIFVFANKEDAIAYAQGAWPVLKCEYSGGLRRIIIGYSAMWSRKKVGEFWNKLSSRKYLIDRKLAKTGSHGIFPRGSYIVGALKPVEVIRR